MINKESFRGIEIGQRWQNKRTGRIVTVVELNIPWQSVHLRHSNDKTSRKYLIDFRKDYIKVEFTAKYLREMGTI